MEPGLFSRVAAEPANPAWGTLIGRQSELYRRPGEIRSEFARDYTRILHCTAYRRLKHKTQVFFATENDHVCTRIEHVTHVASISRTIAMSLGLNQELTEAMAIGHDLGHPPFGHAGEKILGGLEQARKTEQFWHEKNSLWFVDRLETLPDGAGVQRNLDLTYAVRDGIVCHCGEVNERAIRPRQDPLDLHTIQKPGEVEPYSWEGCVVKISDKIAYLGRDIEDAAALGILSPEQLAEAGMMVGEVTGEEGWTHGITNAELIHRLISDLCDHSNPEDGLCFSPAYAAAVRELRSFSSNNIYNHHRLRYFQQYARVVLSSIFDRLGSAYQGQDTLAGVKGWGKETPALAETFSDWLLKYTDSSPEERSEKRYGNSIVYPIEDQGWYEKAAIDYMAGMTDQFAIKVFDELIRL